MSSRSNYSLYAPYVSGHQVGTHRSTKEEEVDALTDLLVQGMDNVEEDVYGNYLFLCYIF